VRRRLVVSSVLAAVAAAVLVVAVSSSGKPPAPAGQLAAGTSEPRAERPVTSDPLPTRNRRARAVEPVSGESAASAALPVEADSGPVGRPTGAASSTSRPERDMGPTSDVAISAADVLKNGIALPPIEAPSAVREIIQAGNDIARAPYLWGGGHGKWQDTGYDCSGSISYALASAGLLNAPLASGPLMSWGKPGKGKWVTIYSNPGHVWMSVAGVRFDTSGQRNTGSRWQKSLRPTAGYVARHPPGL